MMSGGDHAPLKTGASSPKHSRRINLAVVSIGTVIAVAAVVQNALLFALRTFEVVSKLNITWDPTQILARLGQLYRVSQRAEVCRPLYFVGTQELRSWAPPKRVRAGAEVPRVCQSRAGKGIAGTCTGDCHPCKLRWNKTQLTRPDMSRPRCDDTTSPSSVLLAR